MSTFSIRSFCRTDRDQVAGLVNFHAGAVVPGSSVSVNAVLAQFEREPGEFIVDPWVAERHVLVAEQNNAIVAATLLLRYRDEPEVGESMRNAGEIRWLLFTPIAPTGQPAPERRWRGCRRPCARCPRTVPGLGRRADLGRWSVADTRRLRRTGRVAARRVTVRASRLSTYRNN